MERVDNGQTGAVQDCTLWVEAVVATHETALLRYAARIVNSATAAQDVVQNVFIKLVRQPDASALPPDQLKGWLYRVTHNEAVDHVRRESRLQLLHERQGEDPVFAPPESIGDPAPPDERVAVVLTAVRHLHPREQQVVLLRLQEGLSYKEISDVTGRSEGNVGNILHHAVHKLSRRLARAMSS